MGENVPPGSAGKGAAANEIANRGLPYYEKLRRDLRDTIQKKRILDKNLATLEDSLYRLESSYLEETSTAGNIIKGFDNYIKGATVSIPASGGGAGSGTISGSALGGAGRRKTVVQDTDRVFSRSSVGGLKMDTDSPTISSTTTPSHVATPTGSFSATKDTAPNSATTKAAGNNKKHKKSIAAAADDDDNSATGSAAEGKKNKRLKVSYGRD